MPELPEVETVVRGLRQVVVGRRVEAVSVLRDDRLLPSGEALAEGLTGRTFSTARRHGKILFLDTDGGWTLAGHLRMTGQLRVQPPDAPRLPHTHAVFHLDDGQELRWRDVRRFGWLHWVSTAEADQLPAVAALGPDALSLDATTFAGRVRATRRALKPLLLAQDVVAGLGNIYVDEVLWRARLHPLLPGARLGPQRAQRLYEAMQAVLAEAIAARGSSIDGSYLAVDGFPGGYQTQHAVYGRAGAACPRCGTAIARQLVGGRSTHHCPRCQRRR